MFFFIIMYSIFSLIQFVTKAIYISKFKYICKAGWGYHFRLFGRANSNFYDIGITNSFLSIFMDLIRWPASERVRLRWRYINATHAAHYGCSRNNRHQRCRWRSCTDRWIWPPSALWAATCRTCRRCRTLAEYKRFHTRWAVRWERCRS